MKSAERNAIADLCTTWVEAVHAEGRPAAGLKQLPAWRRGAAAAFILDGMVLGGGFSSCFLQARWVVKPAVAGLRSLGDEAGARLVEEAWAARETRAWAADDGESFSRAYWKHRDGDDLLARIAEQVEAHAAR